MRTMEPKDGAGDASGSGAGTHRPASVVVPLRGAPARIAEHMAASLAVPTATSFRDIPTAVLEARRAQLNALLAPRKLSLTHLVAYAIVQAAAARPAMLAAYAEPDGVPSRIEPTAVDLGLAVDVEARDGSRNLLVPVLRAADELDFAAFVAAYDDLVARARTMRLSPDELQGPTITLTNPGTVGTTASVPRLMPGQGTIVASGAIRRGPGGAVMTISSTYDHRVIQGAESGLFLKAVDELLAGADDFYAYAAECLGLELGSQATASQPPTAVARGSEPGVPAAQAIEIAAGMALVDAYRAFGHRAAHLDPLGTDPPGDPALDPGFWGLSPEALARLPASVLRVHVSGATLADALPELARAYTGTISFEVEHLSSHDERAWLREMIESGRYRLHLGPAERRALLDRLTSVEALERFLGRAYLGQKRFSIEGLDMLVPMLERIVAGAARAGAQTVEIGMAHRGRLNVLTHVVGVPAAVILGTFEAAAAGRPSSGGPAESGAGSGAEDEAALAGATSDVKYHRGAEGTVTTPAGPVRVILASNPSHLEAVSPVVEGRTRAEQTDRTQPQAGQDVDLALAVLVHGDGSFAGQGVVAETFNLARLAGYGTGGTVHLLTDNQLAFTVEPQDERSTDYASDLAKGFDVPIIHVNADDPEACLDATALALAYRQRFHGDVVVHLVGYRRHGHNEEDEPAYTQPRMYERIAALPTARARYAAQLVDDRVVDPGAPEADLRAAEAHLAELREAGQEPAAAGPNAAGGTVAEPSPGLPPFTGTGAGPAPETALPRETLQALGEALLSWPDDLTVQTKLLRQLEARREALAAGHIAWAQAEALALASLVVEGRPVRLTGQDTVRGTFSQRHLRLTDPKTNRRFAPIQALPDARASFELYDSPLSEYACLGFEYGYAAQAPEALVLWEAQYGDFANGAEVIIDQFVVAGLAKWGVTSRLTL
ncbi:MAG TPA: multifunctional oxoglutarate decarboxylase/oxoglutarate dehydrogenase thiamine pyrophosphate-binding subunit/dihydrolipoyllysine-residue succinyltransferase subunit, partial [Candidatus Limnocylindrales bacterium]|nr:multifunctional oxoglutarate decarboxylase/oxoglutarate dehydrogenase thiamine pyrophosphate-binding subunit/dihydrolipoyllysine-residue succinyltransferase subunit [Candidatus Limnocylindrales bacterium]